MNRWLEVDRAGLAKIAARRSKTFILRELVQNAWDEASSSVEVEVLAPTGGSPFSTVRVTDDSPEGFKHLEHAYTLFAQSGKVADATKRGRFNFGEKLVLALCAEARIESTTGTILFERGETRRKSSKRRAAGSMFEGKMRLSAEEREELLAAALAMIPYVPTRVNGVYLAQRPIVKEYEHVLHTEVAGEDGMLRPTYRTTTVRLYEVGEGESASLYELGIPVVALEGDRWHIDVGQKVPLNVERDNVPPKWLADLRASVANQMVESLTVEDANSAWARDALSHEEIKPETVQRLVELRFGDKAVIADPSDPEATARAAANGYVVVHGGQFSADEWERVRGAGALTAAGRVFPTAKPFHEDGRPLKVLSTANWTPGMKRFANFANECARAAIGKSISVVISNDFGWHPTAAFGPAGTLYVNMCRVGREWFDEHASERQLDLLIHEFGHNVEGNHLSEGYHDALCTIGAKLARLAATRPTLFHSK